MMLNSDNQKNKLNKKKKNNLYSVNNKILKLLLSLLLLLMNLKKEEDQKEINLTSRQILIKKFKVVQMKSIKSKLCKNLEILSKLKNRYIKLLLKQLKPQKDRVFSSYQQLEQIIQNWRVKFYLIKNFHTTKNHLNLQKSQQEKQKNQKTLMLFLEPKNLKIRLVKQRTLVILAIQIIIVLLLEYLKYNKEYPSLEQTVKVLMRLSR